MKRTNTQKGITLIALIITIVVLLILAVVAISSITNDGILSYATNAATDYNKAVANESAQLGEYVNFLKNEINPVKIITFTIGGTSYEAEEGMTWQKWTNSSYNTAGFYVRDDLVYSSSNQTVNGIELTSVIESNSAYSLTSNTGPAWLSTWIQWNSSRIKMCDLTFLYK